MSFYNPNVVGKFSRLTPSQMFVMSFILIERVVRSGPLWMDTLGPHGQAEICNRNWWYNLLYINNFLPVKDKCFPLIWYLTADFQMYLFSLVILLPLLRWPKVGLAINGVCIGLSIFATGLVTYVRNLPPTMLFIYPDMELVKTIFEELYDQPYCHFGCYGVGIYIGYILATKKLKLRPWMQVTGWLAAIITGFSTLYGVAGWNAGEEINPVSGLVYAASYRTVWGASVGWVILVCASGYGGPVNKILAWKTWVPLGRLTYMAYLLHPVIYTALFSSFKTPLSVSHLIAVWVFFGLLVGTYLMACVVSLMVEVPLLGLEKIFLARNQKQTEKKHPEELDNKYN